MKCLTLKEHFELRNINALNPRIGFGRFFIHNGESGFSDASGAIWPVKIDVPQEGLNLKKGCIYKFHVNGRASQSEIYSKYRNFETFIVISQFEYLSGEQNMDWELAFIADPLQAMLSSDSQNSVLGTCFFRTPTSLRGERLSQRCQSIQTTRSFFLKHAYLELDPPQLVVSGGVERYLKTFKTSYEDHRGNHWQMEMPTSPEFSLKKIIAEGVSRVFALTHAFRNGGELSKHHDPEFMMLEWYRIGGTFQDLITETQSLISEIASNLPDVISIPELPWKVFSVSDLFLSLLSIDLSQQSDVVNFRKEAAEMCSSIVETDSWDDVFCKLFMEFVEPYLAQQVACFVAYYPEQMGALAAKSQNFPGFVDRFEAYVHGVEICNGYRELIDADEFQARFESIRMERNDVCEDRQFTNVMRAGLYPCVGNALGLDRLISVLRGDSDMQSILPWPFASRFVSNTIALE